MDKNPIRKMVPNTAINVYREGFKLWGDILLDVGFGFRVASFGLTGNKVLWDSTRALGKLKDKMVLKARLF